MQVEIRNHCWSLLFPHFPSAFLYQEPHLSLCGRRLVHQKRCQSKCFVLFLLLTTEQAFHTAMDTNFSAWLSSTSFIFHSIHKELKLCKDIFSFPQLLPSPACNQKPQTTGISYSAETIAHLALLKQKRSGQREISPSPGLRKTLPGSDSRVSWCFAGVFGTKMLRSRSQVLPIASSAEGGSPRQSRWKGRYCWVQTKQNYKRQPFPGWFLVQCCPSQLGEVFWSRLQGLVIQRYHI